MSITIATDIGPRTVPIAPATAPTLTSWVEEFVGDDVLILGVLTSKPRRGRPALAYQVVGPDGSPHGQFETFDEAHLLARRVALPLTAKQARDPASPSDRSRGRMLRHA